MGLRRDLTAGSNLEFCRELGSASITLGPERLLRAFLFSVNRSQRGNSRERQQDLEAAPPRPSLPPNVKDFQFRHEHFHLFESDKALLHFNLIYLPQTVWVRGFIHTL